MDNMVVLLTMGGYKGILDEIKEEWVCRLKEGLEWNSWNRRLLIFAPNDVLWYEMADSWDNVAHINTLPCQDDDNLGTVCQMISDDIMC